MRPRGSLVPLLLCVLLAQARPGIAAPPKEPTLAELIAAATASRRPIFLDVFTIWCRPCARLERDVLPQRDVQAALAGYVFQRYDAELGVGIDVAQRLGIHSYPTLMVLAPDGTEVALVRDREPAALARTLRALQPVAATGALSAETLSAERDPAVLLRAAQAAERAEAPDPQRVRLLYEQVVAADTGPERKLAAVAAFRLAQLQAQADDAARHGRLLTEYVRRYPDGRQAMAALQGICALPAAARPPPAELLPLIERVRAGQSRRRDWAQTNDLAYLLLALGQPEAALRVAQALDQQVPDEAQLVDTLAEVHHQLGHREQATALGEKAHGLAPDDPEIAANLQRYRAGLAAPGSGLLPQGFQDPLAQQPPGEAPQRAAQEQAQLGRSLAALCQSLPRAEDTLYLRVYSAGGTVQRAVLLDPEAPVALRRCVERAAAGLGKLPAGLGKLLTLTLRFPVRP